MCVVGLLSTLCCVISGAHLSAEEIAAADAGVASAAAPKNWLDNALGADDVTPVMVENAKSLWRVLPIFAVLPVFWMLFNQQVRAGAVQCAIGTKRQGVFAHFLFAMALLFLLSGLFRAAAGLCRRTT